VRLHQITTQVKIYDSFEQLESSVQTLITAARSIAQNAYAPYSHFHVGAAIELDNGKIITGSNQENVAYPSGLCAERVAIFYAGANYPLAKINRIAVTAYAKDHPVLEPVAPCGSCRQAMLEYENKQAEHIVFYMDSLNGQVYELESIASLLPLSFDAQFLKKS
jgi:cytidine deaminase